VGSYTLSNDNLFLVPDLRQATVSILKQAAKMTVGESEKSTFGLVYIHAANSLRRKAIFLLLPAFILLALFYIPQSPVSLPTYTGVDVSTSPDNGMISTAVPEPDHSKEFPKKIWQSASQPMKEEWAEQTETWISINEEWNYELLTGMDPYSTYVCPHSTDSFR
tara:strand:- start:1978 stop:2469 length:492 start_codon:yes stop_codon:yes gene_type:complete